MLEKIKTLYTKYGNREEYGFVLCTTILCFFICDLIIMNLKIVYYNGLFIPYPSTYTRHVDLLLKFVIGPLVLASICCSPEALLSATKRGIVSAIFYEGAYSLAYNVRKYIIFKDVSLENIFSSECILSTVQIGVFLFLFLYYIHRYLKIKFQPLMIFGLAVVFIMQCYFLIQRSLGNIYFIPSRFITISFLVILALNLWLEMRKTKK